jgi:hypothetical protein
MHDMIDRRVRAFSARLARSQIGVRGGQARISFREQPARLWQWPFPMANEISTRETRQRTYAQ